MSGWVAGRASEGSEGAGEGAPGGEVGWAGIGAGVWWGLRSGGRRQGAATRKPGAVGPGGKVTGPDGWTDGGSHGAGCGVSPLSRGSLAGGETDGPSG